MNGDTLELMKMKKQIEEAKNELAQAEGEIKSIVRQMSYKFGCTNKDQAQRKLKQIDKNIQKKEDEFLDAMDKVKNDFPWGD